MRVFGGSEVAASGFRHIDKWTTRRIGPPSRTALANESQVSENGTTLGIGKRDNPELSRFPLFFRSAARERLAPAEGLLEVPQPGVVAIGAAAGDRVADGGLLGGGLGPVDPRGPVAAPAAGKLDQGQPLLVGQRVLAGAGPRPVA